MDCIIQRIIGLCLLKGAFPPLGLTILAACAVLLIYSCAGFGITNFSEHIEETVAIYGIIALHHIINYGFVIGFFIGFITLK